MDRDAERLQVRLGRVHLYSISEDEDHSAYSLVEVQRRETSAVLDMKWYRFGDPSAPPGICSRSRTWCPRAFGKMRVTWTAGRFLAAPRPWRG